MKPAAVVRLAVAVCTVVGCTCSMVEADTSLNEACVVSVLNRTARVQANGAWVIPNVPANLGKVRVRATCVENGIVTFGASGLITVPANGVIKVNDIDFQGPPPVPSSLSLSVPVTSLSAVGQTVQISATATYPGGSTDDVTAGTTGTDYRTSNPAIATVDANGLVTARASGVALISASNEGALGVIRLQIVASGDSDGDGLPDDFELAHGLDPNNPLDVLDDQDRDGLTTLEEFRAGLDPFNPDTDGDGLLDGREVNVLGTNPLLGDTDGDGIWDGLEVQTGSDPLDPSSFNLAAALQGITVTPKSFTLIVNTIVGEASRQVQVMGQLIDGRSLNITASRYGTTYASSDLSVANFGAEDGRIYAGQNGTATITVASNGFSDTAQVTVQTFAPTALAWVDIPGHAKDVAVAGDYAFVAAGEAGLQVVDISRLEAPVVVGSLDTAGDAQNIKVVGNTAFLADGPGGLVIVDVSSPLAPRLLGQVATPAPAVDIAVAGDKVYVADEQGLRVVDVANPASPVVAGGVDLSGKPSGVDVYGSLVAVSCLSSGIKIVDVADPTAPKLVGAADWVSTNGVTVREHFALAAAGGILVVDFHVPSNPVIVQTTDWQAGFDFRTLALDRGFAIAPDLQTPNSIAILDITQQRPTLLAYMALPVPSGHRGIYRHGLDVRDGVAFVTASSLPNELPPLYSGLEIGRYALFSGETGLPPSVSIVEPAAGSTVQERTQIRVRAEASDDGRVESVQFFVNGEPVFTDFGAPYEADIIVPSGGQVRLRAVATDGEGNRSPSEEVVLSVAPNSKPVVSLLSPVPGHSVIEGGTLTLAADASDDTAVTRVEFYVNDVLVNTDVSPPYRYDYTVPFGATQLAVKAVAYDDVGPSDPGGPVVVPVNPDLPPVVAIIQPRDGDLAVAGALFRVLASASDDVRVTEVRVLLNGVVQQVLQEPPYEFDLVAPRNGSEIHLTAIARDNIGHETVSPEVVLQLGGDPLTTATGTVLLSGGPAAGATVTCQGRTGTTGGDGRFSIDGVPTATIKIRCRAQYTAGDGSEYSGISAAVDAVRGGVTDMGEIQLRPEDAFLYPGPQLTVEASGAKVADVNGDGIPDLIVAAPYDGVAVFLGKPNKGYEAVQYYETAGSPKDVWIGDFNGDGIPDVATANGSSSGVSVLLGNGDGTFQPHIDSAAETGPVALAAGDFNQDGRLDLAGANGSLVVLLGNGDGTLTFTGGFIPAAGAVSVRVGDVNQDGHLDLLSAGRTLGDVRIFRGDGTGAFTLNRTVSLGGYTPDDLTVEDLNGDGRLDFATASSAGNKVLVFFGQADGSYLAGPALATGSRTAPVSIIASDLNGDGHLDLATANNGTNDISLFLGNGSGSFSSARTVFTGASPRSLASADLNRDGIADLVTADVVGVSLIYGAGNATFDTDRRYPAGENLGGVVVGDFNGDGAQDLAVASQDSDEVAVLLGRGDGTFAPEHRFATGSQPVDVVAADFNGDGKLDLATANLSDDSVGVLLGQGDGTFASPSSWPTGQWPGSLRAVDLNGDGHPDLAVANADSNDVSILLGNGDGTFAPQTRYPVGGYPLDLAVGDFNGDGRPDLATANEDSDDVSILSSNADGSYGPEVRLDLGTGQAPPPISLAAPDLTPLPLSLVAADLDGDGKQDLAVSYLHESSPVYQDLLGVLLGNGDGTFQPLRTTPAVVNPFGLLRTADVNGDGIPDLVDASPGGAATQDLAVLLGLGDGTFGEPQRYNVGCGPYYLASGDFNSDGQTDLVASTIGCYDTYDLSILIHH